MKPDNAALNGLVRSATVPPATEELVVAPTGLLPAALGWKVCMVPQLVPSSWALVVLKGDATGGTGARPPT